MRKTISKINNFKSSTYPDRYTEDDGDMTETADNDAGKDGEGEYPELRSPGPYKISDVLDAPPRQSKQKRRPNFSNSFSPLSSDIGDEFDTSLLYSEKQSSYDSDLQTALLLSKTQAPDLNDDDDEELQKVLLLSSMEFAAESNLGKGCDDSDLGELNLANPNLGDLKMNFAGSDLGKDGDSSDLGELNLANPKMKGVCRPPEMNPDRVELAAFNKLTLGEASISVCVLCSDELPTGKLIRLSDKCGHFCCRGCAGDYLGGAIKENIRGENIKCPENKCKETLSWFRCCRHVPPEVVEFREKVLKETKAFKKLADDEAAAQRKHDSFWSHPWERNSRRKMWDPYGPEDMMMNGRRNNMMHGPRNMMMDRHPGMMMDRHPGMMMRDHMMRDSKMKGRKMKGRMMDPYFRNRMDMEDPRFYTYEDMELLCEENEWLDNFWYRHHREPTEGEYQAFFREQMEDGYERYYGRKLDRLDDADEEDEDGKSDEEEDGGHI